MSLTLRSAARRGPKAVVVAVATAVAVGLSASPALADDRYRVKAKPRRIEQLPDGAKLEGQPSKRDGELVHVVQSGDSLAELAQVYGYVGLDGWRVIYDANPQLDNPHLLVAGQRLDIPGHDQRLKRRPVAAFAPPAAVTASAGSSSVPSTPAASSTGGGVWDQLAACESGGNWSANTGNGYSGGLQFSPSTWEAYGGSGSPSGASRDEQIAVAERVQAGQGWGAWPSCSAQLGLGG